MPNPCQIDCDKVSASGATFVPNRLEICQKIYTTQFSGKRILHTENA